MAIPHPIPYQGSKRRLAGRILQFFPPDIGTLYEPFAGSAAITLAAAANHLAARFAIGDRLAPLADLWESIVTEPTRIADGYQHLWNAQLGDPRTFYAAIRDEFNRTRRPADLLYLLARCVKNAVRFNAQGAFNQGADHRRLGMRPDKMRAAVLGASRLLQDRTTVVAADYRTAMRNATERDLVYLDPPYQGVSGTRDPRYAAPLDVDGFIDALAQLNRARVPFIISYDGKSGQREYGPPLPDTLGLLRLDIDAGRSSQATLNGRADLTIESLYLSPTIAERHRLGASSRTPGPGARRQLSPRSPRVRESRSSQRPRRRPPIV